VSTKKAQSKKKAQKKAPRSKVHCNLGLNPSFQRMEETIDAVHKMKIRFMAGLVSSLQKKAHFVPNNLE
jgi:hypothetical protein